MICHHMILHCDAKGCLARFIGPPYDFLGSRRDLDEIFRLSAAEGWSRVEEADGSPRHYCRLHGVHPALCDRPKA